MSTFNPTLHPRADGGQFTTKVNSTPASGLTVADPVDEETIERTYRQYVATALWSCVDSDDFDGGATLDEKYDVDDISDELREQMRADLTDFIGSNREVIDRVIASRDDYDITSVAHDFWLTRNSHGAGFWDRGFGDDGKHLSEMASAHGSVDIYAGDDGKLYA